MTQKADLQNNAKKYRLAETAFRNLIGKVPYGQLYCDECLRKMADHEQESSCCQANGVDVSRAAQVAGMIAAEYEAQLGNSVAFDQITADITFATEIAKMQETNRRDDEAAYAETIWFRGSTKLGQGRYPVMAGPFKTRRQAKKEVHDSADVAVKVDGQYYVVRNN